MSWQAMLDELHRRQGMVREMGGADKVKRQHDHGKLTVRERVERLLDPGSFRELGSVCGFSTYDERGRQTSFTPSNQVIGHGLVDGRPVVVFGDDFTVRGGAADAANRDKLYYPENMAAGMRMPLIRLVDGTGGGGSVKVLEKRGSSNMPGSARWDWVFDNLSKVPVVGLALGSVAGQGAARVAAAHYSLIVKGTAQMFTAGPPLVAHLGQKVTKEELGGSRIHARNGAVDDEVATEEEAFERTRRFLSYLPRSVYELPARGPVTDDPRRRDEKLLSVVPIDSRKVYMMRPIINSVVDGGSFFEIGRQWGRSMITGFARLDGWPVALVSQDPFHYGGAWTSQACEKLIRFVDLAETFHLPVVHLVDTPGFQIGVQAEEEATIRYGVRAMAAVSKSTVPWCSMIIRKAYGVAGGAHRPTGRFTMRYSWLSGQWGSLPLAGGLEVAYKAEIESAADPQQKMQEIRERLQAIQSPFRTAEQFGVEEIIDPRDTRRYLCEFANLAQACLSPGEPRQFYRP